MTYGFSHASMDITPWGLPHSDISGSMLVCSSPKLFAAYHVLRRPPIPRHPSCALSSLTTKKLFRSFTDRSANGTSSLPVSQHKLLAFESFDSNTSCRIFFKTFSLIVNQPAPRGAYISTPKGKNQTLRLIWWSRRGSNPRHPACKAGALAN